MTSSNLETTDGTAPIDASTKPAGADAVPGDAETAPAVTVRKPRASRRIPKSDVVLEAAVERARQGVLEVAPEAQVGRHVSAVVEGERLVTHRFEAFLPGYGGWQWYASVARVSRSKEVTVCEVGLLPSAASLIAPEWLPWSERVRPEDSEPDGPVADASLGDDTSPAATSLADDAAGSGTDASVVIDEQEGGAVVESATEVSDRGDEVAVSADTADASAGDEPSDDESADDEPADEEVTDGKMAYDELAGDEPAEDELADGELVEGDLTEDEPAGDELSDDEPTDDGVADSLAKEEPTDEPVDEEPTSSRSADSLSTDSLSTDDAERPDAG
ncbi:DUF3027 domain-containing protein [Arthrobacter sp. MDT2-16]